MVTFNYCLEFVYLCEGYQSEMPYWILSELMHLGKYIFKMDILGLIGCLKYASES